MYKKVKKSGSIILFMLMMMCVLCGCTAKKTPKKIMLEMVKSLANISSFSNEISVDIKLEDVIYVTEVSMDLMMESTLNPSAGHVAGIAGIKMYGVKLESPLEIYQIEENGENVTYSSLDDSWMKSVTESGTSTGVTISDGFLDNLNDMIDAFQLAEATVSVYEEECYEMYGTITCADLKSLVGEEMLQAYGLVEIPEQEAIDEMMIPITIDVYTEDMLPARIHVDMTDEMNELYDEYGESTNVNDFTIDLKFSKYNEIDAITVPEEVIQAVQ